VNSKQQKNNNKKHSHECFLTAAGTALISISPK